MINFYLPWPLRRNTRQETRIPSLVDCEPAKVNVPKYLGTTIETMIPQALMRQHVFPAAAHSVFEAVGDNSRWPGRQGPSKPTSVGLHTVVVQLRTSVRAEPSAVVAPNPCEALHVFLL